MKKVSDNQINGELGETLVKARFAQMGQVFEQNGRLETGIDGVMYLRDPQSGTALGKMIAVQVKTTNAESYSYETDVGFDYLVRPDDLELWRQTSIPVIIVLHRISDGTFYWKSVGEGASEEPRRLQFDKQADAFDRRALDRLGALAIDRRQHGVFVPPLQSGEPAHLNLIRVLPPEEIFVATSPFASGRHAIAEMMKHDDRDFDWMIRGKRFLSFRDPRENAAACIVEEETVEAVETSIIAESDDRDDEISFQEILRRTMARQIERDIAFDKEGKSYFFRAPRHFEGRSYPYMASKTGAKASVVSIHHDKKDKSRIRYLRHHAFLPRFFPIAGDWFMSLTPTFVFTEDGFRPHRFASTLLAGKKKLERNDAIRGQFVMWRHLLVKSGEPATAGLFAEPDPGAEQRIRFQALDPISMERSVPEDAWKKDDPNVDRLKAQERLF